MSRLHHVSASQITTFRSCKRLWAIEKLAELTRIKEETGALATGSEVHAMLETYLLHGVTPAPIHPHRSKFDAVVGMLPLPVRMNPGLLVEYEFEFPVYPGGTPIVGAMDICLPPWVEPDASKEALIYGGIDDHKTTSDLKYAKTPEELSHNTQLIIYAYYLFRIKELCSWNLFPWEQWRKAWEEGIDRVRVRHNYIKTRNVIRKGQSVQVECWLTWEQVAKEWAGIVQDVKEMERLSDLLWDNIHAIQNEPARIDYLIQVVEGDQNGGDRCHMYGGCDHKGRCPEANSLVALTRGSASFKLEPEYDNIFANAPQMEEKIMENPTDDLAARLQAKMAKKPPAAAAPAPAAEAPKTEVPAPTSAVVTAPVDPATVKPPLERLEGYTADQTCNGRGWYANAKGAGFIAVEKGHKCAACKETTDGPAVTPPDAPCPMTTAADAAGDQCGPNPTSAPIEAEAPKAKRTRKSKAEKAAEALVAQQAAAQATPTPAPAPSTPPEPIAPPVPTQAEPETTPPVAAPELVHGQPAGTAASTIAADTAERILADATETPATSTKPCARLYVNCRPLSGPDAAGDPFAYDRWMAKVLETIRTECGVPHYKLLKFGAGAGALATVMGRLFDELPPVVMVDSMRPEAQEFLDIAITRAAVVVQGVR